MRASGGGAFRRRLRIAVRGQGTPVTDIADIAPHLTTRAPADADRARALARFKLGDAAFYWTTRIAALAVLAVLGGIIVTLIAGAWPAIEAFGLNFLWTQRWAPQLQPDPILGALGPIYGTLLTSFIAMSIATPVGLGVAIFLTELCPAALRRPIGTAIELLAVFPRSSTACGASSFSRLSSPTASSPS